jgi:AcrR family transcriptional regulator
MNAPSKAALKTVRQHNRRAVVLDAAAALFRKRGFHACSMRDIAKQVGMLPGSLYYHFPSKESLLVATYAEGVRRIGEAVDFAVEQSADPEQRLRAACRAHLQILLDASDYAQVVIRVQPEDVPAVGQDLIGLRDRYEDRFRDLIDALTLPLDLDRDHMRRMLLGALNWARHWYQPGGDTPADIADAMLACLRLQQPQEPARAD